MRKKKTENNDKSRDLSSWWRYNYRVKDTENSWDEKKKQPTQSKINTGWEPMRTNNHQANPHQTINPNNNLQIQEALPTRHTYSRGAASQQQEGESSLHTKNRHH